MRRTQAQRLAETRAKIIAATIEYIDEQGFHQASLNRVAQAAQLTVGAVQHHFANKNELLTAVAKDSFRQLADNLAECKFTGGSIKSRINLFIDASWEYCNSSRYQSGLQILLGMRDETWGNFETWLKATLGTRMKGAFELWRNVFADVDMKKKERLDTLMYIFSSLTGTALLYRISQDPNRVTSDLCELKRLLLLRFDDCQSRTRRKSGRPASVQGER